MSGLVTTFKQFDDEYPVEIENLKYRSHFISYANSVFRIINSKQIALIKREFDIIKSFTFEGDKVSLEGESIARLMPQLDPKLFFQIDRSCVINVEAIDYFLYLKSGKIQIHFKVKNCAPFILNQSRARQFKRWVKKL